MKIVECIDLFYPYLRGGGEQRSFEITKRLARVGPVQVITGSLSGAPSSENLGENLKISRIGLFPNPADRRSMVSLLAYVLALGRTRIDADVANYNGFSILGSNKDIKSVCTIHDLFVDSADRSVQSVAARLFERRFAGKIGGRLVVVPSPSVGDKVTRFLKIGREKIRVVPNGIDIATTSKFDGKRKEAGKIVFAGRLVAYKNVHHLLTAFSELKKEFETRLVIIGDGPERSALERMAPEGVTFMGHVPTDVLYDEISSAQVFVNPSTFEGFSIVMLESMALGTPVVGYKLPAYHYADSSNSVLVEPANVSELKDAIKSLLPGGEKYDRLVQNGRETARKYDWEAIVNQLNDVYKEVTGN